MATKPKRYDEAHDWSELVGSLHTVGDLGPGYQVVSIDTDALATIVVLETEEVLQYPISRILTDPVA